MDVTCARCREPWDCYHLRHDEVHETEAGTHMIYDKLELEDWEKSEPRIGMDAQPKPKPQYEGEEWNGTLTPFWKKQFAARGWKFGASIYAVLVCPFCKDQKSTEGEEGRAESRLIIAELLEGDDDGAAAMLEDLAITESRSLE